MKRTLSFSIFILSCIIHQCVHAEENLQTAQNNSAITSDTSFAPQDNMPSEEMSEKNTIISSPENSEEEQKEDTSTQTEESSISPEKLQKITEEDKKIDNLFLNNPKNQPNGVRKKKKKLQPTMNFSFENESLSSIIENFAAKKGINIVLPQSSDALKQKVTFKINEDISLDRAKRYIHFLLDLSGYSMHEYNDYCVITKINENAPGRDPLPLFVNAPPSVLEKYGNQIVRAIYYLGNLRVPANSTGAEPLNILLKEMLHNKKGYLFDPLSNGIIITDKAHVIASTMNMIGELDAAGAREIIEVVSLFNATSSIVAKLLNEKIISSTADKSHGSTIATPADMYFAPNTKVFSDDISNSLILMGKEPAINKLKKIIQEELDAPLESGRSIIHILELQYLEAKEFAKTLQNIVTKKSAQSKKDQQAGPTRFFDDVIIVAEEQQTAEALSSKGTKERTKVNLGGNRLLIAARHDDWLRVKDLVHQLDKPKRQVIVEALILDLTVENNKQLKAQTRNPSSLALPKGMNFQSAHIRNALLDATEKSIAADLLRNITSGGNSFALEQTTGSDIGSMIISLKDPGNDGIWSVVKLLDKFTDREIIAHPSTVTKDNTKARLSSTQIRRGEGSRDKDNSVVNSTKIEDFPAKLEVEITPRISSLDKLNLQISILSEEFIGTGFTKTVRKIDTNANVGSGDVLVLGGLTSVRDSKDSDRSSILSRIPLIGNLFSGNTQSKRKVTLAIFIRCTVVDPKLREGIHIFTHDTIKKGYQELENKAGFYGRDPIKRFYFGTSEEDAASYTSYLQNVKYVEALEERREEAKINKALISSDRDILEQDALIQKLKKEQNPLKK